MRYRWLDSVLVLCRHGGGCPCDRLVQGDRLVHATSRIRRCSWNCEGGGGRSSMLRSRPCQSAPYKEGQRFEKYTLVQLDCDKYRAELRSPSLNMRQKTRFIRITLSSVNSMRE